MPTSPAGSSEAVMLGRRVRSGALDLLFSLLGGFVLALPAWSDVFLWSPYLGLVPWIYLYGVRDRRPPWLTFFAGAGVFWVIYHGFLFGYNWYTPFLGAVVIAFPYLLFPVLLRAGRRLAVPWTLATPVAWVATEWLQAKLALAGVATTLLGYSQARILSLIQVADLGGVYLVSFVVALVSGAIADLIAAGVRRPRDVWTVPRARWAVASAAAVIVLSNLYGFWRLAALETEPGPRVGIVQPGVHHDGLNTFTAYGPAFFMTAQYWDRPDSVDLIVWPENAIQDHLDRFGVYGPDLGWLAERANAPLLVGAYGRHPANPSAHTNSVFLVGRDGEPHARYDKIRLLPWVEYIPFDRLFSAIDRDLPKRHARFAARVVGYATSGQSEFRGEEVTVFRWPGLEPFSAMICFETAVPALAREGARRGARFLVNPTSEGRVGASMQLQMLRTAVFRSVETRLPLVRAGNEGISVYVTPDGRLQHLVRGLWTGAYTYEPGIATERVRLARGGPTVYVRLGDTFVVLCLVTAVGGALWGLVRRS